MIVWVSNGVRQDAGLHILVTKYRTVRVYAGLSEQVAEFIFKTQLSVMNFLIHYILYSGGSERGIDRKTRITTCPPFSIRKMWIDFHEFA